MGKRKLRRSTEGSTPVAASPDDTPATGEAAPLEAEPLSDDDMARLIKEAAALDARDAVAHNSRTRRSFDGSRRSA